MHTVLMVLVGQQRAYSPSMVPKNQLVGSPLLARIGRDCWTQAWVSPHASFNAFLFKTGAILS